jgi:hypothetical protein
MKNDWRFKLLGLISNINFKCLPNANLIDTKKVVGFNKSDVFAANLVGKLLTKFEVNVKEIFQFHENNSQFTISEELIAEIPKINS